MNITFIQTGGTIDKDYPRISKGWAFEIGKPAVLKILNKLKPSFDYDSVTACRKDSLEINDNDREELVKLINEFDNDRFIVTHGTDTMIDTAKYLGDRIKDKVVIITGSMRPELFYDSDAPVNIGAAVAAASLINKGVYVTMHGIIRSYNEIDRSQETGKFF